MGIAVIVEAILSFVNLSISTDDPTWGGMIAEGRTSIHQAWVERPLRSGAEMSYLVIKGLSARLKGTTFPILRNVSLTVGAGEVHGLVGESGAGKSMIGKAVLGILPSSIEITHGTIELDGVDLLSLHPAERRRRIGASAALIPQDPLTALNPSRRIGPQITNRLVDILGWSRAE
eukprot:gene15565-19030_t